MEEKTGWDLAREAAKKERDEKIFQSKLRRGREAVSVATTKLEGLGFTITNISNDMLPDPNHQDKEFLSPFDLLATRGLPNTAYIIDVKLRTHYDEAEEDYWVTKTQLLKWQSYITASTKILLFVTAHRSIFQSPKPVRLTSPDARITYKYVLVSMIEKVAIKKISTSITLHIKNKDTNELDLLS